MNVKLGAEGKGRIQGNIPLWIGPFKTGKLPAKVLGILHSKPNTLKKRVRKVINEAS